MALTARERQARRRAKIRSSKEAYVQHLQYERHRKQHQRAAQKEHMTDAEIKEFQLKEKIRIRNYREEQKKKKENIEAINNIISPYKTNQAGGKAVKKTQLTLPKSPRKRLYVIEKLVKNSGLSLKEQAKNHSSAAALPSETKQLVADFYQIDEISWQAPGRKDRVIIRSKNKTGDLTKTTEQVRYMLMSLREAYNAFTTKHGSLLGLSKFCELRPMNVKTFDHIPHNVCVCPHHENIRLLLQSLRSHTTLSTDISEFIEQITCNSTSKSCMTQSCLECEEAVENYAPTNPHTTLEYRQWRNGERTEIEELKGTVGEAFAELKQQLKGFLLHTYIKRCQSQHLEYLISNSNDQRIVLQVDFSENATILSQNEVQSAHWHHHQATLFTAYAWINGKDKSNRSIVLISDCLQHTKYSVYMYMDYIFCFLKEIHPTVKHIDIFSDGAGSQFKQRYLFSNLYSWQQKHELQLTWNFFATSHGKGVVDGLGGTVKRSVWRYIKSGKSSASNAEEYSIIAEERNPNIHIKFIAENLITNKMGELDDHWKGVMAVPRTHKMHFVAPVDPYSIQISEVSSSDVKYRVQIRDQIEENLESGAKEDVVYAVGQWVMIEYDKLEYPGEISKIVQNDIQVNVMHKSGHFWKWPETCDEIFYKKNSIIKLINPPTIVNSRGLFTF